MKSTKNYSSGHAFERGVIFPFHYFHDLSLFVPFHWTFFQHFCLFPFNFWDVGVFFPSSVWTLLACVSRNPKLSRNIYGPQLRWSVWFITLLSFIYLCLSVLLWNLSRSLNVNKFSLSHDVFGSDRLYWFVTASICVLRLTFCFLFVCSSQATNIDF